MKTLLWLEINSSYAHSSLALPSIHAQRVGDNSVKWKKISATINSNIDSVVADVFREQPDIVAATAWLFNHEVLLKVVGRLKQLLPHTIVILGGPEMQGDNEIYLRHHPFVNCVFRGEGEREFHSWLKIVDKPSQWGDVVGLCFIGENGKYCDNGYARVNDFGALIDAEESPFFDWSKPFVQLETTRGCPNSCAFCVSGRDKPVRYLPIERVRVKLELFRQHGIRDIRLLDRTFNGNSARACELLKLFREFSDVMRFHLEIHPGMLSVEVVKLLMEFPAGVLHLEAGIQSINAEVLQKSRRFGNLERTMDGLKELIAMKNLVVHTDLIAGLPGYSLRQLVDDVRSLIVMGSEELQLELLKVLPGTEMCERASELGVIYAPDPPYEVLQTYESSIYELDRARLLSRLLDNFYNCDAWQQLFRRLVIEDSHFILRFLSWLEKMEILEQPLSLEKRGALLYKFCSSFYPEYRVEVSVAWISVGIPFNREPSRTLTSWNKELPCGLKVIKGGYRKGMRLYYLPGGYYFGFDRSISPSKPLFIAVF